MVLGELSHLRIDLRQIKEGETVEISKELAKHLLDVYDKVSVLRESSDTIKALMKSLEESTRFIQTTIEKSKEPIACAHVWERDFKGRVQVYFNGTNSYVQCSKCGQRKQV